MERIKVGMLAWSRAGHDNGQLYVITKTEDEFVFLSDGRLKPIEYPKKKNKKHIQIICKIPEELENVRDNNFKNEDIRKVIRRFTNV